MDQRFDYRFATEEDIVRLGRLLVGRRLGSIPGARFLASSAVRGKGEVGAALEHHFGISPNSRSEADFPGAGIELKIVPVVRSGNGFRIKERTVITMVNYQSIMSETWPTAHVRSKLQIYFVFFEHLPGRPKSEFPVLATLLWRPDSRVEQLLQADWERVRAKVVAGLAHDLSEGDGTLMGPCTKGAHSSKRVPQPVTVFSPSAKSRAFALKPAFTATLFRTARGLPQAGESIVGERTHIRDFERTVIRRSRRFVGMSVGDVAAEFEVPASDNKSYAAGVVRRIFGAKASNSKILEFQQMGIDLRVPRVDSHNRPYEALSFPAFRHMELIDEEWIDSTLLAQLDGLLLAPIRGRTRGTPPERCTFMRPFIWRPTQDELAVAEREWTRFRDLIRAGRADSLPGEAQTEMIHVRPHARNALDVDEAPGVGAVTKKSFWLNKRFVQSLIESRTR